MAQKGGARPGAGRKAGPANQRTQEILRREMESGRKLPLEVMLDAMREACDEAQELRAKYQTTKTEEDMRAFHASRLMAVNIAKDAAPFCHPKLQHAQLDVSNTLHEDALDALLDGAEAAADAE